jgi:hemolysin activation/secretion protein
MNKLLNHLWLTAATLLVLMPVFTLAAADTIRHFDIWEYRVDGNTLLSPGLMQSALYPFLGPQKTLDDIEQARAAIQSLYKQNGYPIVVVAIPEQNVIGGIVRLQVVEGRVGRLKISGNEYFSRREIRQEMSSIEAGQPLNMQRVREELDNANRLNPYRSLTPVIRPGRRPGTMELELKVQDRLPFYSNLEVNNRYTASTSKSRLLLSAGYDNLWQQHHSISLNYQTTPENTDEVDVWNLTYVVPTGSRSRLALFAVDSNSQTVTVTDQGDDLTVLGNGRVYGLRSISSINVSANSFASLVVGFDYKDFGEDSEISNPDDATRLNVPIDYSSFTLSYNASLKHGQDMTRFSLGASFALKALGNDDMVTADQDEFDFKRSQAKGNFFVSKASISQNWAVDDNWQLYAAIKGQYTQDPLISNEQFSVGGVDSVRGYLESSALGDNGVLGNLEVHYNLMSLVKWAKLTELDLSYYVDFSQLRVLEALPNSDGVVISRSELVGTGIGLTLQAYKSMQMALYFAVPLKDLDAEDFDDDPKLHFRLGFNF